MKGDFSQFGDQALWLLQSIAESGAAAWSFDVWQAAWLKGMTTFTGYPDSSIRNTKKCIDEKTAIVHDFAELAGIARLVVLVPFFPDVVRVNRDLVHTWTSDRYLRCAYTSSGCSPPEHTSTLLI